MYNSLNDWFWNDSKSILIFGDSSKNKALLNNIMHKLIDKTNLHIIQRRSTL